MGTPHLYSIVCATASASPADITAVSTSSFDPPPCTSGEWSSAVGIFLDLPVARPAHAGRRAMRAFHSLVCPAPQMERPRQWPFDFSIFPDPGHLHSWRGKQGLPLR